MHDIDDFSGEGNQYDPYGGILTQRGLTSLQQWLGRLEDDGLASRDEEGVVRLSHTVAARFGMGYLEGAVFVALPSLEITWARLMPWAYAAVKRGMPDLFLVASPVQIDTVASPPFSVGFSMDNLSRAQFVARHTQLDLRSLLTPPGELPWKVSRQPFAQLPVVVLDRDAPVLQTDLLRPVMHGDHQHSAHGQGRLF